MLSQQNFFSFIFFFHMIFQVFECVPFCPTIKIFYFFVSVFQVTFFILTRLIKKIIISIRLYLIFTIKTRNYSYTFFNFDKTNEICIFIQWIVQNWILLLFHFFSLKRNIFCWLLLINHFKILTLVNKFNHINLVINSISIF